MDQLDHPCGLAIGGAGALAKTVVHGSVHSVCTGNALFAACLRQRSQNLPARATLLECGSPDAASHEALHIAAQPLAEVISWWLTSQTAASSRGQIRSTRLRCSAPPAAAEVHDNTEPVDIGNHPSNSQQSR